MPNEGSKWESHIFRMWRSSFESATLEKLLATHASRGQGQGADEFGTGDKLDRQKHSSAESESNKGDEEMERKRLLATESTRVKQSIHMSNFA